MTSSTPIKGRSLQLFLGGCSFGLFVASLLVQEHRLSKNLGAAAAILLFLSMAAIAIPIFLAPRER